MTNPERSDCEPLARLTGISVAGQTVLRVGLLGTLYFEDAHTPAVREGVMGCLDDSVNRFTLESTPAWLARFDER